MIDSTEKREQDSVIFHVRTQFLKGLKIMGMAKLLIIGLLGVAVGAWAHLIFTEFKRNRIIKTVPDKSRIVILREYSGYDTEDVKSKHSPQFVLNNPVPEILLKYNYNNYCNKSFENNDEIVFSMLNFVCDNFSHISNARLPDRRSLDIIIKSCEKADLKTNCRGLSLILAEVLRMNGMKARHITCKPFEEPFADCHVVVDCLLPSGKRIMLDPTYRLYFRDDKGEYVSIEKFREGIINGIRFYPNADASYNGQGFSYGDYIEYMSKNLLRLNANYNLNDRMPDKITSQIELVPLGYSVDRFPKIVQYTTNKDYFWNID